tara:strand:+ start:353 stop:1150 length:798 start_codon:yes stop_codon:yes gene_type:complete
MNFKLFLQHARKKKKLEIYLLRVAKSRSGINEKKRKKMCELITNMDSKEASIIYKDLCYLYICACNDEHPDKSKIEKLTLDYSSSFIKSIVDVGDLIEKLADASCLDKSTRRQKWLEEQTKLNLDALSHMKNANKIKSWSSFSLSSRSENEKAYLLLRSQISQINLPPCMKIDSSQTWGQIIMLSIPELQAKPPHFFHTIHTQGLSLLQKRALTHKLNLIYNIIPTSTRNIINEINVQIFNENNQMYTHAEAKSKYSYLNSCNIM